MSNKYLSKIAGVTQVAPPASLTSKIALGVSTAGLGVAGANYHNNQESRELENRRIRLERDQSKLEEERAKLEAKSLNALTKIHKALTEKP